MPRCLYCSRDYPDRKHGEVWLDNDGPEGTWMTHEAELPAHSKYAKPREPRRTLEEFGIKEKD